MNQEFFRNVLERSLHWLTTPLLGGLPFRMPGRSLFRRKQVWAAAAAMVLALTLAVVWTVRGFQRAELRDLLNTHPPFQTPPLEIVFPRLVVETDASREVLDPGVRMGLWRLWRRGGQPAVLEVRLTDRGYRLFSVVGNQIIATFKAGTRQVTTVQELGGVFPSRRARFRYVWKNLHPDIELLGPAAPQVGKEYDGEALLSYEKDRWNVLHWSTPGFDEAVARFRRLLFPDGKAF